MNARELWQKAAESLLKAGVPDAKHDALRLMEEITGHTPLFLLSAPQTPISGEEEARYFALINRRANREPLQYILGFTDFMGQRFLVRPGVLIPRQDSETLCLLAIDKAKPHGSALDLCCGSGCLGLSLQAKRPDLKVTLSDVSDSAIALTQKNAEALKAQAIIKQGDLFDPHVGQTFDLILSNPPYIALHEAPSLDTEVQQEPGLALFAGEDGLTFYRRILSDAASYLNPGGVLLLEIGSAQADSVSALVKAPFLPPRIHFDLAGLPRVLETKLKGGVH